MISISIDEIILVLGIVLLYLGYSVFASFLFGFAIAYDMKGQIYRLRGLVKNE